MEYISLDKLRNPYPLDKQKKSGVISQTYKTKAGDEIVNQGVYPIAEQSFPQPPQRPENSIEIVEGTTFRFILRINGIRYTSKSFARDLERARQESNPYFNETTVPVIDISTNELVNTGRDYKVGLEYAEATVNRVGLVGGNPKEIAKYIDSLTKPILEEGSDKLTPVSKLGSWNVNISEYDAISDTGMGFEFSELLEIEKKLGSKEVEGN